MKTKHTLSIRHSAVILIALLGIVSSVLGGSYVSPKGKFHITYPASWKQIDYTTVDAFLQMHQAGESVLDYDAAFADSSSIPFFDGVYGIVTVDAIGELSEKQIDSILHGMSQTFGKNVRYFPVSDLNAQQKTDEPVYDKASKIVTVISDVVDGETIIKKHAYIMKFYKEGIANFFFYAPDSLFTTALPTFEQIVQSLSTENLETAVPKQELKVAEDIQSREIPKSEDSTVKRTLPFFGGGLFVIILVLVIRMRRKREQQHRNKQVR
jgi:hypothetical protein